MDGSKRNEPGTRSPGSEEAQRQNASGDAGGPRAGQEPGTPDQPAQASGRRGGAHEQPPEERKGFQAGEAPSEQGRGEPRAQTIARHQQGISAQSGSRSAHGNDTEEQAQRGEPEGEHTRHGRQHVPGDRVQD